MLTETVLFYLFIDLFDENSDFNKPLCKVSYYFKIYYSF